MKQVTQTILMTPENKLRGVYGNCYQAAIAAVLELDIEAVPHFMQFLDCDAAVVLWCRGMGIYYEKRDGVDKPTGYSVVSGLSPRNGGNPRALHACVALDGEIVWDPHPSRDGLLDVREYEVFTRL